MIHIGSYREAEEIWTGCRSKLKGKPMGANGSYRMKKSGDSFEFILNAWRGEPFHYATLSPDNVLEFTKSGPEIWEYTHTLIYALNSMFPFSVTNKGSKRYVVGPYHSRWSQSADAPELFSGMRIDMTSGWCLNPKPGLLSPDNINPAARKKWLADLRHFKRRLKVEHRLGSLQAKVSNAMRTPFDSRGDASTFAGVMQSRKLDADSVQKLRNCVASRYYYGLNLPEAFADMCIQYTKTHSVALRKEYGVFRDAR